MVADVTTILGKEHRINIDEMDLGKGPAGDVSLMLLATSTPVPPEVVAELRATDGIVDARAIELD
jgi:predicted regulator of amino acid metabolism with ACT domain